MSVVDATTRRFAFRRSWPATMMLCALATYVAGCSVGPDFRPPQADAPAQWHDLQATSDASAASAAMPASAAVAANASAAQAGFAASTPHAVNPPHPMSVPTSDSNPDPHWWKRFNDPQLDSLVERAARSNLNLQESVLRIIEARTQVQSAAAQGLPNLRASGSYTREQLGIKGFLESQGVYDKVDQLGSNGALNGISPTAGATTQGIANQLLDQATSPVNLWQAGFDATWELDLFGRVRRSVEAANAQTQAAVESTNDALLSLEAEVAQTYLQLRGAQALLAVTQDLVDQQRQIVELTQNQAQVGIASQIDVASAAAQLATTRSQLPQYEQQIAQSLNGLSFLLSEPPGSLSDELGAPRALPGVPPDVPVGLPSTLARRRPDIRRAEATLHAATADVGVAVAQFYPDISLTGSAGTRATNASDLSRWSHLFYSFGPTISLPIFQGGALVANLRMSKAQQAEAAIGYRNTVLTALRDVDNALAVYRTDQDRRNALADSVAAQQTNFDLSRDSYQKGIVTFINVLDAERQLAEAKQQYTQETMQVSTDLVALYKALGGGWQASDANGLADATQHQ